MKTEILDPQTAKRLEGRVITNVLATSVGAIGADYTLRPRSMIATCAAYCSHVRAAPDGTLRSGGYFKDVLSAQAVQLLESIKIQTLDGEVSPVLASLRRWSTGEIRGSIHGDGRAIDVRTRMLTVAQVLSLCEAFKRSSLVDQVLIEGPGAAQYVSGVSKDAPPHLHIRFAERQVA